MKRKHLLKNLLNTLSTAAFLAGVLFLGMLAGFLTSTHTRAQAAIDLTTPCSLTLTCSNDPAFNSDLEGNISFALYKVADAVQIPRQSSCQYEVKNELLGGLQEEIEDLYSMTADKWVSAAQTADKLIKASDLAPNEMMKPGEKADNLDPGLYLVVAMDPQGGSPGGTVLTPNWEYTFPPELISLPCTASTITGAAGPDGSRQEIKTSDGDWQHDVSAVLKPGREHRLGNVEIVKSLSNYARGSKASFLFSVEAVFDGEPVYSDIVPVEFDAPGDRKALVEGIPAGSEVTVTEVYSGASYHVTTEAEQAGQVAADDTVTFSFTNDYDAKLTDGDGIINSFTYSGVEGQWTWQQE